VAVLLTKKPISNKRCGEGYLNTLSTGKTLSTVGKECARTDYAVGHEIGHNVGLHHDRKNVENPKKLRPKYATGHLIKPNKNRKDNGGYRTLMAYSAKGHKNKINYYSNPSLTWLATGTPLGVNGVSNNAKVLRDNMKRLAAVGDESSPCKEFRNRWYRG